MKEIIELNRLILTKARHAVPKDFGFILVTRYEADAKELGALPVGIRGKVEILRSQLARAIPNDFDYHLVFGDDEPGLLLVFRDGMTEGDCSEDWDISRSIFHQLSEVDWDKHRQEAMKKAHIFDDIREIAKQTDFVITPTAETQKRYTREVEAFLQVKRADKSKIYLLHQRYDEGVQEVALKDLQDLRGELIDALATNYIILAVIADGKPMPPEKVDEFITKALNEMKIHMPISYAKATGLFQDLISGSFAPHSSK